MLGGYGGYDSFDDREDQERNRGGYGFLAVWLKWCVVIYGMVVLHSKLITQ